MKSIVRLMIILTVGLATQPALAGQPGRCSPQVAHKYENEIVYAQNKVEEIQHEIENKLTVIGITVLLPEEELPLWLNCLSKLHDAEEIKEIPTLYSRLKYAKETYLAGLRNNFLRDCPVDYFDFYRGILVQGFLDRQRQLKQQQAQKRTALSCRTQAQQCGVQERKAEQKQEAKAHREYDRARIRCGRDARCTKGPAKAFDSRMKQLHTELVDINTNCLIQQEEQSPENQCGDKERKAEQEDEFRALGAYQKALILCDRDADCGKKRAKTYHDRLDQLRAQLTADLDANCL
jgi:hypothetical protein